ncbi:MAG: hypothetical protein ACUVS0_18940, partial [Chloroflexus sp.]
MVSLIMMQRTHQNMVLDDQIAGCTHRAAPLGWDRLLARPHRHRPLPSPGGSRGDASAQAGSPRHGVVTDCQITRQTNGALCTDGLRVVQPSPPARQHSTNPYTRP